MLLRKVHEELQKYNKWIQEANANPSSPDYQAKCERLRDEFNKRIIELVEEEKYRIASKGS